jgi:acyl-CoA reductase-like NAD-dependent aldehyde dehydrogenase
MLDVRYVDVINPSNGELIKKLICDSAAQIENKIQASHRCYMEMSSRLNVAQRIRILEAVLSQMLVQQNELAMLIATEGGKPLIDALVEAQRAAFGVKLAIGYLLSDGSNTTPINSYPSADHYEMTVTHQPIGSVIAVSAFNHPLNLVTHQIVSAFAAGCPCLIKPAADTPLSCIKLIQLFTEAGTPPGWIDYVITTDNELAQSIVTDPRFAFFSFIGSAKVGWYLRSKLPPGTRCALEHGGIAPAFVDETADIERAVKSLTRGAFYHAGQVCVSTQRIYIAQSIFQQFKQQFCDQVDKLRVGDACDPTTQIGPLIRQAEADRVGAWVDESKTLGAEVCIGGKPLKGQFYSPTVLSDVPANAMLNTHEVFGPVCCLSPYTDLDGQIQQLNNEAYSFHSAVFSNSNTFIQKLYSELHTGCLMVNEHTAFRHDAMTFAGLKQSGLGAGGMSKSIHHMQTEKLKIMNVG